VCQNDLKTICPCMSRLIVDKSGYNHRPIASISQEIQFSWIQAINLDLLARKMSESQQLTTWKRTPKNQLDAIFCPRPETLTTLSLPNEDIIDPLYAITALVNNMPLSGNVNSNNACAVFGSLSLDTLSQILKNLPTPVFDALRERLFVAAVKAGKVGLVSAMLELNVDPSEETMMDQESTPKAICSLEYAVAAGDLPVAKTILTHMCKDAAGSCPDELLKHVLTEKYIWKDTEGSHYMSNPGRRELICITLEAGARPTEKCLRWVDSLQSSQQLHEATMTSNLTPSIQAGWLVHCASSSWPDSVIAVRYIFDNLRKDFPPGDLSLRSALLSALKTGARKNTSVVPVILEALYSLGYASNTDLVFHENLGYQANAVRECCEKEDWHLAATFVVFGDPKVNSTYSEEGELEANPLGEAGRVSEGAIREAITEGNPKKAWTYLKQFPHEDPWEKYASTLIELDTSDGVPRISIEIIQEMKARGYDMKWQVLTLLESGHIAAVGALLQEEPQWHLALGNDKSSRDFGTLGFFIFQSMDLPYVDCVPLEGGRQQLCFRVLAFYAMTMNDFDLCQWLFQLGMDSGELSYEDSFEKKLRKVPVWCDSFRKDGTPLWTFKIFPSLLAVAAERNLREWVRFLLTKGSTTADSMALLRAVKFKAEIDTIRLLLDAPQSQGFSTQHNYGSAALRQAMQHRDPTMIGILCGSVKTDSIELSTQEHLADKSEEPISPLGQAIKVQDYQLVEMLLQHGASPNACISTSGLQSPVQNDSWVLGRVTPLLAAIDIKNLTIARLLVEAGAEISYKRSMGIFRTPLQRAAEVGSMEIVQYLISQGVEINATPAHSSGTALQLAAMNGYCGIVRYLLDLKVDPNYPPSRGDGRTAFEAAAEWARYDVLSLLMQRGVQLELTVGEPPESQYERAKRFAEMNGHMATKRHVELLWQQYQSRQDNQTPDQQLSLTTTSSQMDLSTFP
ncbi:Ank-2 multi-domain protein, partial [Pyrenophora tritici-repentis]